MKKLLLITGLLAAMFAGPANAILMTPVSSNAYITVGGYDIAWASPCAAVAPSCSPINLTYQSAFGWSVMSSSLYASLGIDAYSFVFKGANVDYATGNNLDESSGATVGAIGSVPPPGDIAVATPWFSNDYKHADWVDGLNGQWSFSDLNGSSINDTLVVRKHVSDVPEPETLGLLGLGLLGIGFMRKKKA